MAEPTEGADARARRPAVRSDQGEDGTTTRHGPRARRDPRVSEPAATATSCASSPVELIAPNPHQPRSAFDEDALQSLAESIARARRPAAGARPPAGRRDVRARRRRAPLARRAARRPGDRSPRSCASATTRPRSSSRSSRTWPARTSTRSRRRAPAPPWSRSSGSRARRSAAASAAAASRSRTSCACSTCPTRRSTLLEAGDLTEGHGRALLLAEDHAARRRLARTAAAEGWSVRDARGARPRGQRLGGRHARAPRSAPRGAASRPGGGDRGDRPDARRGARRGRQGPPGGARASRSSWRSPTHEEAAALAGRIARGSGATLPPR